jgi:aspartate aminotransferase
MDFSENIARLQPSATIAVSTLAKRLKAEGRDIVDLSAGQPDFDTPEWISDAGIQGIRGGGTRYTPVAGMPELRKAIADHLSARAGRAMDPEGVVVSSGAKQALFNAVFALAGPGDEVLVATPYWTSYPQMVVLSRAEPVFVQGAPERNLKLTPEDLDAVATPRTRILMFSTPSNPTGAVYSLEELTALAEWARDRDVWLLSDEIYREICFNNEGRPAVGILDLPPESLGPAVLIDGVSKAYAMTGWRIGYSWSEPAVAKKLAALQSHTTSNAATPSQFAAMAAYVDRERSARSIGEMNVAFRRRRDLVVDRFKALLPSFPFVEPQGAFYLFFSVEAVLGGELENASDFCTRVLEEEGVAMVPGAAFGDDRYVRLSYATSDELLEDAIGRIARFVEKVS